MPRKKKKPEQKVETETKSRAPQYRILNLTQKMFPVPVYDSKGEIKFMNLRLQKRRRGQTPPVIAEKSITPALRQLEKKRMIKLEQI